MVLNVDKKKWVTLAKDFGSLEFDAYGQLCLYQITIYQYSCIEIALKYETSWCQVVPSGTKVLSMYFPSGAKWSSFTFPCGHKIFWVSASAFDIAAVSGWSAGIYHVVIKDLCDLKRYAGVLLDQK